MYRLAPIGLLVACVSSNQRTAEPPRAPAPGVPDKYVAGRDRVLALGRAVVSQLAGDVAALHARFGDTLAARVSAEDLAAGARQLQIQATPLRDAVELRRGADSYDADISTSSGPMRLRATFGDGDRITMLKLSPQAAVPAESAAPPAIELAMPFRDLWYVRWGGATELENYHVIAPAQRHAFDFVVWRDGATFRTDGATAADYGAWDQAILSPAAGTVVEAVDGVDDNVPPAMNPSQPFGNHVVIEAGPHAYVVIGHLQRGSIAVAVGAQVGRGDALGRCGNSGNTSEPHVHVHAQDRPKLDDPGAVGIPIEFIDYGADGADVARGAPTRGQFVVPR